MASSKILTGPPFLFDVRTDYVKVTNDTVIVPITLQIKNSDITFNTKDGVSIGKVEIQGRVSNMTHKPIQTFEDTGKFRTPSELLAEKQKNIFGLLEGASSAAGAVQGRHRRSRM